MNKNVKNIYNSKSKNPILADGDFNRLLKVFNPTSDRQVRQRERLVFLLDKKYPAYKYKWAWEEAQKFLVNPAQSYGV